MGLQFLGIESYPTYIALSTDITSGSIVGAGLIGKTVYTTDDQKWYIVAGASGSSFYLETFVQPKLEA